MAEAPGNVGLMDQVEALRWVQTNIHNFAGNPDLVTVFGQSAGAASSSWMYLTPLTNETFWRNNGRQLLHRVIPQSGSALEEWTLDKDPETAFHLAASTLKCNGTTKEDKLQCMKDKPYEDVQRAALKIYVSRKASLYYEEVQYGSLLWIRGLNAP
ncbi:Carboxylesterase 1C [Chionoecetes opilio]|uniref:Carboxylesterase 1C n=1 Tax=Chionoecetes opilio TaxID=41210 RepID=A0A8J4YHY6_CHIOP|nr:Carboxylesterase 1C [Chionoecetes opilio]